MTSYTQTVSRRLPRGWMHLAAQFAFWLGFYVVYQLVRGIADRDVGGGVLERAPRDPDRGVVGNAVRADAAAARRLVRAPDQGDDLHLLALPVRRRRRSRSSGSTSSITTGFAGFRNWLIAANLVGLVGYVLIPTAPPRMFPEWGFVDTLAQYSGVNHEVGLIAHTANPYAAMPSLHSMDAFIVGVVMFGVCRSSGPRASSGCCGRPGSGSRSWAPATTTGSTSSPASRSRLRGRRRPLPPRAASRAGARSWLRDATARAPSRASASSTGSSRSTRRRRGRSCSAR